jgi:hypothetical protein
LLSTAADTAAAVEVLTAAVADSPGEAFMVAAVADSTAAVVADSVVAEVCAKEGPVDEAFRPAEIAAFRAADARMPECVGGRRCADQRRAEAGAGEVQAAEQARAEAGRSIAADHAMPLRDGTRLIRQGADQEIFLAREHRV